MEEKYSTALFGRHARYLSPEGRWEARADRPWEALGDFGGAGCSSRASEASAMSPSGGCRIGCPLSMSSGGRWPDRLRKTRTASPRRRALYTMHPRGHEDHALDPAARFIHADSDPANTLAARPLTTFLGDGAQPGRGMGNCWRPLKGSAFSSMAWFVRMAWGSKARYIYRAFSDLPAPSVDTFESSLGYHREESLLRQPEKIVNRVN